MGAFNPNALCAVSLAISDVSCDCRVRDSSHGRRVGGLITFRGRYHPGSAGKDDARWIKWRLNEFYDLTRFDGLVVDCQELDYTWGDDLHLRPDARSLPDNFPFLLVIRAEQEEAFAYSEPRQYHRFDLMMALAEIDGQLRAMRERQGRTRES